MDNADPKIHEAIGFFEQMLQTMPGDRTSLEFLSVAYEQVGQSEKRRDCLIRLADCLLHEKDFDNAQVIAGYLSAFSDYRPAREAVERVANEIQGPIVQAQAPREPRWQGASARAAAHAVSDTVKDAGGELHALSRSAAAAEMDLVWLWKERDYLPKELCMDVLHVLTDHPVTDTPLLISALALLDEQHPEWTERLMEAMQRACEMPPVPVELFELQPAATALLPAVFVQVKGALPFALMGNELLVALLNPLNKELQKEIVTRVGRPCHFFMAHPKSWQSAVSRMT